MQSGRAGNLVGKLTQSTVRYFSTATSTAIIRVARAHCRMVWAALTFINVLPKPVSTPCVIQVVRVSGTIRKAEEEAIRRARDAIHRARRETGDASVGLDGLRSAQLGTLVSDTSTTPQTDKYPEEDEDAGTVVAREGDTDTGSEEDDEG
jgi:ribonuclease P/MRP protein subunit POP5